MKGTKIKDIVMIEKKKVIANRKKNRENEQNIMISNGTKRKRMECNKCLKNFPFKLCYLES